MKFIVTCLLFLFLESALARLWNTDVDRYTNTGPVQKILDLLKDLQTQIEDDEKKEQKMYDTYACWCERATKRTADSIGQAREDIRSLGQQILSLKGKVATLMAEIAEITKSIDENEKAQEEATEIRGKENKAYQIESTDLTEAIAATEKAVTVLQDATKQSFLQSSSAQARGKHLKEVIAKAPAELTNRMAPEKLLQLGELSQDLISDANSYQPQSATIQGILKDMYNTFTDDLESMTSDEAKKNKDYEDFTATKISELIAFQQDLKKKGKQKVEAEMMLAEAMQAFDETEQQLKADIKLFDSTNETCTGASEAWSERKQLRSDELDGVKKALKILSSDEAKESINKALSPSPGASFFQVYSISEAAKAQQEAVKILKSYARPAHSLGLARVASDIELANVGHFDKAIISINKMIALLKEEAAEDLEKFDECKNEYQSIKSDLADLDWKIEKSKASLDKIKAETSEKEDEKTKAEDDLKDVRDDMKDMKKTRKDENEAFKTSKKEDEAAIELLKKAKDALSEYYDKHAELLQRHREAGSPSDEADPAPELKFGHKSQNKNKASGVVGMIELVIEDLEGEIAASVKAEKADQLAFEKNTAAAEEVEEKLNKKITSLKGAIADLKDDKKDEDKNLDDHKKDKKDVEDHEKDIKPNCDWVIDNYDTRTKKRQAELDGLNAAKAFLAGYKPEESLVQKSLRQPIKRA